MRIGIDARFLTHPQPGGFKTYTVNLIRALSQIDDGNSYVIYLDRPPRGSELPRRSSFSYQIVGGTWPVLGVPLREQLGLRMRVARDKLDLTHFLCNTAPVGLPGRYVVTLHDTIQVTSAQTREITRGRGHTKRCLMAAYSKWAILRTARGACRVITVSNYEKSQIARHLGVAPERIAVTPLAPNPVFAPASSEEKAAWRKEMRLRLGLPDRFVLGVGYEPRKNIPLLIEAFAQIAPRSPGLALVVVAAEPRMRVAFQQFAAEQGLDGRVVVLPAASANDLAVMYNLAEVFVYPSERESFGLPPLEAIACGTPTIAMDASSVPEVLRDGALLVGGRVPQEWADTIWQAMTNERLRADLARRGLRRAEKLTWEQCATETLRVYRAVADEAGAR